MRNIYNRKLNIFLISALVGMFLCSNFSYESNLYADNALRVPIGEYDRLEEVSGQEDKRSINQGSSLGGPKWWVTDPRDYREGKYFRFFVKQLMGRGEMVISVRQGRISRKEFISLSLLDSDHIQTVNKGGVGLLVSFPDEAFRLARPEDMDSGNSKTEESINSLREMLIQDRMPSIDDPEELLRLTIPWYQRSNEEMTFAKVDWNEVIVKTKNLKIEGICIKVPFTKTFGYRTKQGNEALKLFLEDIFIADIDIPVVILPTPDYEYETEIIPENLPANIQETQEFVENVRNRVFERIQKSNIERLAREISKTILDASKILDIENTAVYSKITTGGKSNILVMEFILYDFLQESMNNKLEFLVYEGGKYDANENKAIRIEWMERVFEIFKGIIAPVRKYLKEEITLREFLDEESIKDITENILRQEIVTKKDVEALSNLGEQEKENAKRRVRGIFSIIEQVTLTIEKDLKEIRSNLYAKEVKKLLNQSRQYLASLTQVSDDDIKKVTRILRSAMNMGKVSEKEFNPHVTFLVRAELAKMMEKKFPGAREIIEELEIDRISTEEFRAGVNNIYEFYEAMMFPIRERIPLKETRIITIHLLDHGLSSAVTWVSKKDINTDELNRVRDSLEDHELTAKVFSTEETLLAQAKVLLSGEDQDKKDFARRVIKDHAFRKDLAASVKKHLENLKAQLPRLEQISDYLQQSQLTQAGGYAKAEDDLNRENQSKEETKLAFSDWLVIEEFIHRCHTRGFNEAEEEFGEQLKAYGVRIERKDLYLELHMKDMAVSIDAAGKIKVSKIQAEDLDSRMRQMTNEIVTRFMFHKINNISNMLETHINMFEIVSLDTIWKDRLRQEQKKIARFGLIIENLSKLEVGFDIEFIDYIKAYFNPMRELFSDIEERVGSLEKREKILRLVSICMNKVEEQEQLLDVFSSLETADINEIIATYIETLGGKRLDGERYASDLFPEKLYLLHKGQGETFILMAVINNLIENAIRVAKNDVDIIFKTSKDNGFIKLEVSDTGPGIARKIFPRIFEEGFTTKPEGQEGGLGLYLMLEYLKLRGGRIQVDTKTKGGLAYRLTFDERLEKSEITKSDRTETGTTFTIWLPLDEKSPAERIIEEHERDLEHLRDVKKRGFDALSPEAKEVLLNPESAVWGENFTPRVYYELYNCFFNYDNDEERIHSFVERNLDLFGININESYDQEYNEYRIRALISRIIHYAAAKEAKLQDAEKDILDLYLESPKDSRDVLEQKVERFVELSGSKNEVPHRIIFNKIAPFYYSMSGETLRWIYERAKPFSGSLYDDSEFFGQGDEHAFLTALFNEAQRNDEVINRRVRSNFFGWLGKSKHHIIRGDLKKAVILYKKVLLNNDNVFAEKVDIAYRRASFEGLHPHGIYLVRQELIRMMEEGLPGVEEIIEELGMDRISLRELKVRLKGLYESYSSIIEPIFESIYPGEELWIVESHLSNHDLRRVGLTLYDEEVDEREIDMDREIGYKAAIEIFDSLMTHKLLTEAFSREETLLVEARLLSGSEDQSVKDFVERVRTDKDFRELITSRAKRHLENLEEELPIIDQIARYSYQRQLALSL